MLPQGLSASVGIASDISHSSLLAGSGLILVSGVLPLGLTTGVAAPVAVVAAGRVIVSGGTCPVAAAVSTAVSGPVAAQGQVAAGVAAAVGPGAAHGPVAWGAAHAVARVCVTARHLGVVEGSKQPEREKKVRGRLSLQGAAEVVAWWQGYPTLFLCSLLVRSDCEAQFLSFLLLKVNIIPSFLDFGHRRFSLEMCIQIYVFWCPGSQHRLLRSIKTSSLKAASLSGFNLVT